jgi:CheY-like chemotaxis protein
MTAILLVDDNAAVLAALRLYLEKRGYETACAEHGEAALEALGRRGFDVVLSDINMPGMDGIELCRQAGLMKTARWLPVLLMSGVVTAETRLRAQAAGAVAVMEKPFALAELRAWLERIGLEA